MNDPVEAKFEEVSDHRKRPLLWALLGLLVGLMPGIAGILLYLFANPAEDPRSGAMEARLLQLEDQVRQIPLLEKTIHDLEQNIDILPKSPNLEFLTARLAQFEKNIPDLRPIDERLLALERQIGEWKSLQPDLAAFEEKVTKLIEERPVPDDVLLGSLILQWRSALDAGRPFSSLLEVIEKIDGSGHPDLQALIERTHDFSNIGAPRLVDLQQSFPIAELAKAARATSKATSFWDMVNEKLSQLITIRRVEPTGDQSVSDHLAIAEKALRAGNLEKTVAELEMINQDAASIWLSNAKNRIEADQAAVDLDIILTEFVQ